MRPSDAVPADLLDSERLFEVTAGLPDQLLEARARAASIDLGPTGPDLSAVVVCASGAGAIAGEGLRAIAEPNLPIPVVSVEGFALPGFVGPSTLVLAISYSGGGAEASTCAAAALERGSRLVTISAGGGLARLAEVAGIPHLQLPGDLRQGRQAFGPMLVALVVVLGRLGLLAGTESAVEDAIAQLRARSGELVTGGRPASLAARIDRTFPLICGASGIGAVAARRWKSQVHLNAKCPAIAVSQPGLMGSEIAGFGQAGDVTRQLLSLVELHSDFEDAELEAIYPKADELLREVVADVLEVRVSGTGRLAQLLDLTWVGDFVSLQLAARAGIDPGPAPAVLGEHLGSRPL